AAASVWTPGSAVDSLTIYQLLRFEGYVVRVHIAAHVRHAGGLPAVKEDHARGDELRHVAFLALRCVPAARAEPAFHVYLTALVQVLLRQLGLPVPRDDAAPALLLAPLAVHLERPALGDGKPRHGRAIGRVAHLGVLTQVADDFHSVEPVGHSCVPCDRRWLLVRPEDQVPDHFFRDT